jgi:hypothetical protein
MLTHWWKLSGAWPCSLALPSRGVSECPAIFLDTKLGEFASAATQLPDYLGPLTEQMRQSGLALE